MIFNSVQLKAGLVQSGPAQDFAAKSPLSFAGTLGYSSIPYMHEMVKGRAIAKKGKLTPQRQLVGMRQA